MYKYKDAATEYKTLLENPNGKIKSAMLTRFGRFQLSKYTETSTFWTSTTSKLTALRYFNFLIANV